MPLGRDYRPAVGSVEVSGYPCLPEVAQSLLEPSMRFRTKAYVPMHLDTGGRGSHCDPGCPWERHLCPPPPQTYVRGCTPQIFPIFSWHRFLTLLGGDV